MNSKELKRREKACAAEAEVLRAAREEKRRNYKVRCEKCNATTKVKKLTFIQTHWYREPYGCTGGDYWNQGEGQFACPRCGHINRLYNRPEIEKLKRYFKGIQKTYKR